MKTLKVEKLEGIYVFCVDTEKKMYAIEQAEAPAGVKAGDFLKIDDEGVITLEKDNGKKKK